MNKILKGLLVTALAVSAAQVNAYSNKTFMAPRPVGVDLPMGKTTFMELASHKGHDRFGGTFAATGFYKASANGKDAAKYFLFKDKSEVSLKAAAAGTAITPAAGAANDFDTAYLIHEHGAGADTRAATLKMNPEQLAYGVRFDYHQCLGKILKGLYLYANLPVAHVENNLKLDIASSAAQYLAAEVGADTPVKTVLTNYFNGTFANTAVNTDLQSKLAKAKIAGKRSATGVADIDLGLGYKFLEKETYHAALALALTVPTGSENNGDYAFEAVYGNNKHFALGGDLCAGARVWGDMDHNIKLSLSMKYRYLFESKEKRTLGLKNGTTSVNFGQYYLLAPISAAGQFVQDSSLVPAANVTTLDCDVTPGSQFDGVLGLAYNNGGFSFDLGYNMYFREAESLKLKGAFADDRYMIVARSKDTHAATANVANNDTDGASLANARLKVANLDIDRASTPSQFTNGVYSALGYSFKEWDTPVMLGVGGKYEWASKNSALDQWNVYGKLGIGF